MAEWFWFSLSLVSGQAVGWGCSHVKAQLGFQAGESASKLTHVVGRFLFLAGCRPGAQFLHMWASSQDLLPLEQEKRGSMREREKNGVGWRKGEKEEEAPVFSYNLTSEVTFQFYHMLLVTQTGVVSCHQGVNNRRQPSLGRS